MSDPVQPALVGGTDRFGVTAGELHQLRSPELVLTFHPGRGGSIVALERTSDGAPVLWEAPWGVLPTGSARPPASASVTADEHWSGGWRTLFPTSGRAVTLYGADWGYDGEACLAPYRVEEQSDTRVRMTARLARTPIRITRMIELDRDRVRVTETVRNEGRQAIEVMWGQEISLGAPLLSAGATIETGASVVRPEPDVTHSVSYDDLMPWPRTQGNGGVINLRRAPAEHSGLTWQAYLSDFTEHRATVTNAEAGLRVDLTWDAEAMPFLWYQLEAGGQQDFPHFSGSYYLSLTPSSSWPRQGVNDARRVSSTSTWLSVDEELNGWVELRVSDPRESRPPEPESVQEPKPEAVQEPEPEPAHDEPAPRDEPGVQVPEPAGEPTESAWPAPAESDDARPVTSA